MILVLHLISLVSSTHLTGQYSLAELTMCPILKHMHRLDIQHAQGLYMVAIAYTLLHESCAEWHTAYTCYGLPAH